MFTPTSSAAPSTVGGSKAKLPLAVRKNVRDNWETEKPELEKRISDLLGVSWKTDVDVAHVYSFAESDYAKDNLGDMIKSYIEAALSCLQTFTEKYGQEGKTELNTLASTHTIVIDSTSNPKISYTGGDINTGVLRILFAKDTLGTNVSDSLLNLADAINEAGTSDNDTSLNFHARSSIRLDYEPAISAIKGRFERLLSLPVFDIEPNFERNYAALLSYSKSKNKSGCPLRDDWQKSIGEVTLECFTAFGKAMEEKGFGHDELLREGLNEAVERNMIALRVVEGLVKGHYNEPVVEGGVLYVQTKAEFWGTNVGDPGYEVVNVL